MVKSFVYSLQRDERVILLGFSASFSESECRAANCGVVARSHISRLCANKLNVEFEEVSDFQKFLLISLDHYPQKKLFEVFVDEWNLMETEKKFASSPRNKNLTFLKKAGMKICR